MNIEGDDGWADPATISREWEKAMKKILHEANEKQLEVFFVLEIKKSRYTEEKGVQYTLFMQKMLDFSDREKNALGYDTRLIRFSRNDDRWDQKLIYFCPTLDICNKYLDNPGMLEKMKEISGLNTEMVEMMIENAERLRNGK